MTVAASELVTRFKAVAGAIREAVGALDEEERRRRTERRGQYHLDLVADDVALSMLGDLDLAIVSEESGRSGRDGAETTVVIDPVDGSTNASRRISYWATSICAVDAGGLLAALVVNQATGEENVAVRGEGATRDGRPLRPSSVERPEDSVLAFSGRPPAELRWKQYRVLGCASLTLCDVAAGALDASIDEGPWHAVWDYLGGMLVCQEAGAVIVDGDGEELMSVDPTVRRRVVAASTPELLDAIRRAGPLA